MKIGVRKPNIKKSVKARTTGKIKRSVKRSVNPLYGKKGMGFAKDPERSIKNAVYHRTTIGVRELYEKGMASTPAEAPTFESGSSDGSGKGIFIFLIIACAILLILGLLLALVMPVVGIAAAIGGIFGIVYSVKRIKKLPEQ